MSLFDIFSHVFTRTPQGPTPEEIAEREQRLAQLKALEEERRKEEMKREKLKRLRRVVHDVKIAAIFEKAGFAYDVSGDYLILFLPYSFKVYIKDAGKLPLISAKCYVSVAKMLQDFILEHQDLITSKRLEFGGNVRLNKDFYSSRLTFSLPLGHNLVVVMENKALEAERERILSIVKEMTDIFIELLKRAPSSRNQFYITH